MGKSYQSKTIGFSSCFEEVLTIPASPERYVIHSIDIGNSSGSAAAAGWGVLQPNTMWNAGQWDDSETGTEFTDDTTDAQDAGASDFALTTTTNNDGFIIESVAQFGMIEFDVGTAEAGTPVYEWAFYNGSTWTTFTPIVSPDFTGTGKTYCLFGVDANTWARGAETTGYFAIRLRATTAPSTAPLATTIKVASLEDYVESVDDGKAATGPLFAYGDKPLPFNGSIVPYLGDTTAANNWIKIDHRKGA